MRRAISRGMESELYVCSEAMCMRTYPLALCGSSNRLSAVVDFSMKQLLNDDAHGWACLENLSTSIAALPNANDFEDSRRAVSHCLKCLRSNFDLLLARGRKRQSEESAAKQV